MKNMKYKVWTSFDEINYVWIIIENGKMINRNATKEEILKIPTRAVYYNKTNICPICRDEDKITDYSILYPGNAEHYIDKNGIINEWACKRHHNRNYKRYNPNSWNNIEKSLTDRRTGNLHDPSHILGDNCEELTKKLFGVERLSLKYNNFRLPLDHTKIPEKTAIMIGDKLFDLSKKLPETKGSHYHYYNGYWHAHIRNKDFDVLILYCISEDGKIVERIYVIHKYKIKNANDSWRKLINEK